MTRPNPIPHIKAVRPQAIADEGDTIVFEIETADGGRQSFGVVTGLLSPIVTVLQQLGAEADAYRNRRPEEFKRDEVVVPYLLRSAKVGMAGDGSVVVRLATSQGTPIQIAMSPEQATDLAAKLRESRDSPTPLRS